MKRYLEWPHRQKPAEWQTVRISISQKEKRRDKTLFNPNISGIFKGNFSLLKNIPQKIADAT